jgi:hypothetical protein
MATGAAVILTRRRCGPLKVWRHTGAGCRGKKPLVSIWGCPQLGQVRLVGLLLRPVCNPYTTQCLPVEGARWQLETQPTLAKGHSLYCVTLKFSVRAASSSVADNVGQCVHCSLTSPVHLEEGGRNFQGFQHYKMVLPAVLGSQLCELLPRQASILLQVGPGRSSAQEAALTSWQAAQASPPCAHPAAMHASFSTLAAPTACHCTQHSQHPPLSQLAGDYAAAPGDSVTEVKDYTISSHQGLIRPPASTLTPLMRAKHCIITSPPRNTVSPATCPL